MRFQSPCWLWKRTMVSEMFLECIYHNYMFNYFRFPFISEITTTEWIVIVLVLSIVFIVLIITIVKCIELGRLSDDSLLKVSHMTSWIFLHDVTRVSDLCVSGWPICSVRSIRSLGTVNSSFGNQFEIATEVVEEDAAQRRDHTSLCRPRLAQCRVRRRHQRHRQACTVRHQRCRPTFTAIPSERNHALRTALRHCTCSPRARRATVHRWQSGRVRSRWRRLLQRRDDVTTRCSHAAARYGSSVSSCQPAASSTANHHDVRVTSSLHQQQQQLEANTKSVQSPLSFFDTITSLFEDRNWCQQLHTANYFQYTIPNRVSNFFTENTH